MRKEALPLNEGHLQLPASSVNNRRALCSSVVGGSVWAREEEIYRLIDGALV